MQIRRFGHRQAPTVCLGCFLLRPWNAACAPCSLWYYSVETSMPFAHSQCSAIPLILEKIFNVVGPHPNHLLLASGLIYLNGYNNCKYKVDTREISSETVNAQPKH